MQMHSLLSEKAASQLHPPWDKRVAMVNEAVNMLKRFEDQPPPLAGSGHQWIADEKATQQAEWKETKAAVSALKSGIRIQEHVDNNEETLSQLLSKTLEPAARLSTDDTSPGYMAYIPAGGLFHSAIADFLGSALNRYVTINEAAPALAAIEHECVDWACRELVGWKRNDSCAVQSGCSSGGMLTSGGSVANLLAIHAARRAAISNDQLPLATLYVSTQSHYCIEQAARFVGLQPENIRRVPCDSTTLKMDINALDQLIEEDLAKGLVPIAVCATAGTTNTGTCDNVQACAHICTKHRGVWLHVDAAYGGAFALTSKGRETLGPLELADSVVIDPHKGLFMPYGLGMILFRDQNKVLKANHIDGACMQPPQQDTTNTVVDIMNLSPELTRDFRGLRMWLPLKMLGASTFREALEEKLYLAAMAAKAIDESGIPGLRVIVPPELSIFTFKLEASNGMELDGEDLDQLNIDFLEEIHKKGNVLLSPFRSITDTPGEFSIRMAILSHRTDKDTVQAAVRDIIDAVEVVRSRATEEMTKAAPKALPDRSSSIETALNDPVSDYRALAGLPLWSDLLHLYSHGGNVRVLDVCSGTGRWMQAFAEMVLPEQEQLKSRDAPTACNMDSVDLCNDSLSVLKQRRSILQEHGKIGTGKIKFADATILSPDEVAAYDIVTNMHGLYGFPGTDAEGSPSPALQDVLKRMMRSLKPGGTLVISIAHRHSLEQPSFYDRIGRELSEMGITDAPYACAEDVLAAFASLGIDCGMNNPLSCNMRPNDTATLQTLTYSEQIHADDKDSLKRFVLEESGANSFPSTFDGGGSHTEKKVSKYLMSLAKSENWDEGANCYRFPQRIGVFTFRKSALMPDIISRHLTGDSFYNEAYSRRRQASSQHKNTMTWLKSNAANLLPEKGRTLRILSIGCGNGDLELALLDACSPEQSVHVIGLEPSDEMRMEFMESISKRSKAFRHKKKFTLSDVELSEENSIDNLFGNGEEPFDLVVLGQVLYYFKNAAEIIDRAQQSARVDGGRVIVIHQWRQGVPEVQKTATVALRNCTANMLTSNDIVAQLGNVDGIVVDQIPALLDLSEVLKGTDVGKQIMSFTLEVDLRGASESVLHQCQQLFTENSSFVEHDIDGSGPPGAPGPFLQETVTAIMLPGLAKSARDEDGKEDEMAISPA